MKINQFRQDFLDELAEEDDPSPPAKEIAVDVQQLIEKAQERIALDFGRVRKGIHKTKIEIDGQIKEVFINYDALKG